MNQEKSQNSRSKYGKHHVPMCVQTWIKMVRLTKSEFFELYPDYDYDKEGLPQVLIQRVQEKQEAKRNRPTVKELEKEVDVEVERESLNLSGMQSQYKEYHEIL